MSKRPILGERTLNLDSFKGTGILELLEDKNWLLTITNPQPFASGIVYEFYSNVCPDFVDPSSPRYLKVYVRGKVLDFSPQLINEYFACSMRSIRKDECELEPDMDSIATELTGSSTTWPKKSNLLATTLTTKYSILFRIALFNWIPKIHATTVSPPIASFLYRLGKGENINLGNLIFGKIASEINATVSRPILGYPSLIYNVLMAQEDIKDDEESLTPLAKPLTISNKLLHGKHMVDIEGERVSEPAGQNSVSTYAATKAETKIPAAVSEALTKMTVELSHLKAMVIILMQDVKDMKAIIIPDHS